jgi:hypothetical protein
LNTASLPIRNCPGTVAWPAEKRSGFSASEEIGAGFIAREEQKKIAKITFTVDGEKYERPFSAFDPITYIYTGGDLESDNARLITAIGDLGIMIASDPFLAVSKIRKAREAVALATQTSKGIESAKNIQKLAFLDAQLDENVAAVRQAFEDVKFAPNATKAE